MRRGGLLLLDGKRSSAEQCISLCKALGIENFFKYDVRVQSIANGVIPPWMHLANPACWGFKNDFATIFEKIVDLDIVIGCGRRTAGFNFALTRYLRNNMQMQHLRNVQILDPRCSILSPWMFDAIVSPSHDYKRQECPSYVVKTTGSLTWVSPEVIKELQKSLPVTLPDQVPRLVVFLGGDTVRSCMNVSLVSDGIVRHICESSLKFKSVVVVGSRRTPQKIFTILEERREQLKLCGIPNLYIYSPPPINKIELHTDALNAWDANPYVECLVRGDAFLVSADSVSMLSDACSTGKPVVIINDGFDEKNVEHKLRRFHSLLLSSRYVQEHLSNQDTEEIPVLQDCVNVARILKKRFGSTDQNL